MIEFLLLLFCMLQADKESAASEVRKEVAACVAGQKSITRRASYVNPFLERFLPSLRLGVPLFRLVCLGERVEERITVLSVREIVLRNAL